MRTHVRKDEVKSWAAVQDLVEMLNEGFRGAMTSELRHLTSVLSEYQFENFAKFFLQSVDLLRDAEDTHRVVTLVIGCLETYSKKYGLDRYRGDRLVIYASLIAKGDSSE